MVEIKKIPVNDGGGLYDAVGLIDNLITILNDVEVRGAKNLQHMMLAISGLQTLKESIAKKKKEAEHGQDHSANPNT